MRKLAMVLTGALVLTISKPARADLYFGFGTVASVRAVSVSGSNFTVFRFDGGDGRLGATGCSGDWYSHGFSLNGSDPGYKELVAVLSMAFLTRKTVGGYALNCNGVNGTFHVMELEIQN